MSFWIILILSHRAEKTSLEHFEYYSLVVNVIIVIQTEVKVHITLYIRRTEHHFTVRQTARAYSLAYTLACA